jgi:hypothetical protein
MQCCYLNVFAYINECIDVNTALKKFLQIYELFGYDTPVSKKFPTLASPRLYLVIFFQIYAVQWPEWYILVQPKVNKVRKVAKL